MARDIYRHLRTLPASVIELSFPAYGSEKHANALRMLFGDFAAASRLRLPHLKEIHLNCDPDFACESYMAQCANVASAASKAGVDFRRKRSWIQTSWEYDDLDFDSDVEEPCLAGFLWW